MIKDLYKPEGLVLDLPVFYRVIKEPEELSLEVEFDKGDYEALVFPRINYNKINIFLNDKKNRKT